jgi:hypothetical protein
LDSLFPGRLEFPLGRLLSERLDVLERVLEEEERDEELPRAA